MAISRVLPGVYVCRLQGGGQTGYKNHCIACPQDVQQVADVLPRLRSKCKIMVMRMQGRNNTQRGFKVRGAKVEATLRWLKNNNTHFAGIGIVVYAGNEVPQGLQQEVE